MNASVDASSHVPLGFWFHAAVAEDRRILESPEESDGCV